jgi:cell division septal protein FtsQ
MTPVYQGRALARESRRPTAPPWRTLVAVVAAALAAGLALRLPWKEWRARYAVVTRIEVRGNRYLDADHLAEAAGVEPGDDLLRLDLRRLRRALERHPRVARASVSHAWPRGIRLAVEERVPVLAVDHGTLWEMDSAGVLLPPLESGVLADVPVLTGPDLSRLAPGARVSTADVRRALAWVRALADPQLQLLGQLSEVDPSEAGGVALVMNTGTRVRVPDWPPEIARLAALRVVLADLAHRGIVAAEVDLRFKDQVIVRPAATPAAAPQS